MQTRPPDAFLSYTRFDDEHSRGALTRFREELADAVQAATGSPFYIFMDLEGIGIGEHWSEKLDKMLDRATFFIPILTPNYFTSQSCRRELATFLNAEVKRDRSDLVLSIYYITCDILEDESKRNGDALARELHRRQHEDWRELRSKSRIVRRRAMERLALRIVVASKRLDKTDAGWRSRLWSFVRHPRWLIAITTTVAVGIVIALAFPPPCDTVSFSDISYRICGPKGGKLQYDLVHENQLVRGGTMSMSYEGESGVADYVYSSPRIGFHESSTGDGNFRNASGYRLNIPRKQWGSFAPYSAVLEECKWDFGRRSPQCQKDPNVNDLGDSRRKAPDDPCWQCRPWTVVGQYSPHW